MKWRFIYRGLKARYRDQRPEISALIQHLKKDDLAIDVGANKGSYLWALSKAVPNGKVVAFEPQPKLSHYLQTVCPIAGLKNVEIYSFGVSDSSSLLTLGIPGGSDTSPGASFEQAVKSREPCHTIDVKTVTLDEFFKDESKHIGAIKIDVEGHELSVLMGAKNLIKKHRPVIVCESENRHMTEKNVSHVFHLMTELNYSGYFYYQGAAVSINEFNAAVHQSEEGERFWDSVDYCNNFIFTPENK